MCRRFIRHLKETNKKCKLVSCNNKKKFRSFTTGYFDFCSSECNNKWLSETRKGEGNPIHRISDENKLKWKTLLSKKVKERIKMGNWTPEVTNSWCHSRIKIKFKRNGKEVIQNVRSSWEAFYQLMNTEYEYEKLRIPYEVNNEWHNYIVDFIDNENKIVVEIKPKSEERNQKNKIKQESLLLWCNLYKYKYISINEDFLNKSRGILLLLKTNRIKNDYLNLKNIF